MEATCGGSSMKHIKTWSERCEDHPDHQTGMISERMIQERMQEEIDELRQALETEQEPVAWMCSDFNLMHRGYSRFSPTRQGEWNIPVYTAPPKAAEWFDCTDAQLIDEVRRRGFVIRDAQIDPAVECMCGICKLGKREWVGLTDENMEELFLNEDGVRFARYIEAKLKEKNT